MTEENNCIFISTIGFRKSCDFFSLINDYRYVSDINFDNIKDYDLLYIKTDYLTDFYNNIDKLKKKVILVCGCSDFTIPYDVIQINNFEKLLNNENILHIYAQNCIYSHKKITNLPIGLDYHTLTEENVYWGSMKTAIEQENELLEIRNKMKPFYQRHIKIYSNCHFYMDRKFGYDRYDAMIKIPTNLLFLEPSKTERIKTWYNQIEYAFVVSPHGNGLDCYRTWEALLLGCIPIVKKSNIDDLYKDLPVLIVNDWSDVNIDLLIDTINKFKTIDFNYKKLELKYWINNMRNHS